VEASLVDLEIQAKAIGIDWKKLEEANLYELAKRSDEFTLESLEKMLKLGAFIDSLIEQKVKFLMLLKHEDRVASVARETVGRTGRATFRQQRWGRTARWRQRMERSMSVRVKKPHPALKHGGYSATTILPGGECR
jgi:phenylacetate-coenzyme A ligase PaaK-like adenylate-forming protein